MNAGRTRLPGLAVLVLGLALLSAGAAEVWVARKADGVANLVRPEMTDAGLAQHRSDFESARDTVEALQSDVLPAVARSLGVSPEGLESTIARDYPAVAKLLDEQDEIIPFAESGLVNLERQQSNFQSADSLPLSGVPGYAGGVVSVVLACELLAAGVLLIRMDPASVHRLRAVAAVVAVSGGVLLAGPLALRIPQKAADAQEVLDSLDPSAAVVRRTEDALETVQASHAQLRDELFPDLASALGMSTAQFQAALVREFPETARGLEVMPDILERYEARLAIRQGGAPDLRTLKDLPIAAFGWFDPAFGLVLGAVAAWLWLARGPTSASESAERLAAGFESIEAPLESTEGTTS